MPKHVFARLCRLSATLYRAQRDVNDLLTEDPLNSEAIAAAFGKLRDAGLEYQDIAHRQTLAIFGELTPEQRVSAMRFIQERSRPPGERNRDRND
jgi:Spy/CpxP family protein refolding chaperone